MRLSRRNLCCTAVLCSFFLLTSCSSHQKSAQHPALDGPHSEVASSEAPCVLPSGDVDDVDGASPAEPEESAKEEIAALNRPGAWETDGKRIGGSAVQATGYELSGYDFPVIINKQVNYYLELFQGKQRKDFARWLSRSAQYVPEIERELMKAGLPRDLAFLAMIESGYNPSAVSCAGAGGLWQFMPATGRQYDLSINSWVDERRQPEKATKAAIRYLSRLYRQFNDWHLAVAAYNTGEGKIEQAIKTHGTTDFWELAASEGIYMETKRYVPKLIAAIIIARNPEAYGFRDIAYLQPHRYEVVQVPAGTDLNAVASTAGTSVKLLRSLNNELLKNHTPLSGMQYALRLPLGCKDAVMANLDTLRLKPAAKSKRAYATHVVKRGETLSAISKRYQVSMTDLLKSNKLRVAQLKAGQRLQVPVAANTRLIASTSKQPENLAANVTIRSKQVYRVKKGDTLDKIARQNGVSVAQIKKWNSIKDTRSLQAGQRLNLQVAATKAQPAASAGMIALTSSAKTSAQQKTAVPAVKQKESTIVALAANKTAIKNTVASKTSPQAKPASKQAVKKAGTPASWYVVQNGDSMWTIAKKFSVSVDDIRQWNKLPTNKLQVGNRLRVKRG